MRAIIVEGCVERTLLSAALDFVFRCTLPLKKADSILHVHMFGVHSFLASNPFQSRQHAPVIVLVAL